MVSCSDLAAVRDDLAYERRRYDEAERAPFEGRLADPVALALAQEWRAERIRVLEAVLAECGGAV